MWILSLWANPLARKIILYGAASVAIFFAIRLWSNRVWDEGYRQGKTAEAIEMEKAKQAEWTAKANAIAADAAKVAGDRAALQEEASALSRSRRDIQDTLSRSLNQIFSNSKGNNAKVAAIPGDQLDSALRSLSTELAAGARTPD